MKKYKIMATNLAFTHDEAAITNMFFNSEVEAMDFVRLLAKSIVLNNIDWLIEKEMDQIVIQEVERV